MKRNRREGTHAPEDQERSDQPCWHAIPAERCLDLAGAHPHGLTQQEAEERLAPAAPLQSLAPSRRRHGARPPAEAMHWAPLRETSPIQPAVLLICLASAALTIALNEAAKHIIRRR
jgi:hypothetical protein